MRQLLNNLFILKECKLGDASSTVYLLKTNSKDGLIIIDTGIGVNFKKKLNKIGLNPKNIKHCLITHSHIDHLQGCKNLMNINPDIRYYMHQKDVKPTEMVINKENNINFQITDSFKDEIYTLRLGSYNIKCIHIPGHTPGGMAFLTKVDKQNVLFAGDLCGGGINSLGGNHQNFKRSLQKLLDIKIDILCEGHMNIIEPTSEVIKYIKGCLKINDYLHIGFDLKPENLENWYNLALVYYQLKIYDNAYDACKYIIDRNPEHSKAKDLLKKLQKNFSFTYEHRIEQNLKKIYGENY